MNIDDVKVDFAQLSYLWRHNIIAKYREFNKYLDLHLNEFDPNGSLIIDGIEIYDSMWSIYVVMEEYKFDNTEYVIDWTYRLDMMSKLVIRLWQEFPIDWSFNFKVIKMLLDNIQSMCPWHENLVENCLLNQFMYSKCDIINNLYANDVNKFEVLRQCFRQLINDDKFEVDAYGHLLSLISEYMNENLALYTPEQWSYRTSELVSILIEFFFHKKYYRKYNKTMILEKIMERNMYAMNYGLLSCNVENEQLYIYCQRIIPQSAKRLNDDDGGNNNDFHSQRNRVE